LSEPAAPLRELLGRGYGVRRVVVRRRLEGGYANDLYDVDTDRGRLVVRVIRRPFDRRGPEWETRIVRALAPQVPEVVAPLPTREGSTVFAHGDDAVVVLPFVDGVPADPDDHAHRAEAAALLGRFHAASRSLEPQQRPGATRLGALRSTIADGSYFAAIGPTARPLPPELERRRREIEAGRAWMLELVEELARTRGLDDGLIHGDYFRGNVLVGDGKAVGLVDFEEARLDWRAADLANAVWEFCKDADMATLNAADAHEFVGAYRAAGGTVPAAEDDLLVPLIRVRRLLELLRAPYDRHVDWDYQRQNLDAFQRLG
jgi:homoserine kinase type II